MSFSDATAVSVIGAGVYGGDVEPGWDIFGVTNGGYLLAMAARAMSSETGDRDLASITGYFTNPGKPGPVTIEVETIKSGSSVTTTRCVMTRDGKPLLTAIAAFADPERPRSETVMIDLSVPDFPPPDECLRAIPAGDAPFPPPFVGKVDLRVHPEDAAYLVGGTTGAALMRGWFRPAEGEEADPLALVIASDAFPPAVFNSTAMLAWTPTLELTVHIRDIRPRPWLKCEFRTRFVTGGWLEEDGVVWDEEGNLVAQSRQLALVPR